MRNLTKQLSSTNTSIPAFTYGQNLIQPRVETESIRQLSCEVVFGSPSANCMGTGVCRITARTGGSPQPAERKRNCQSTVGLMFPVDEGNGLALVLTRGLLCTRLYRKHLRFGSLTLESPCTLPADIVERLGLNFDALQPGEYRIDETDAFVRVNFQIRT